MLCKRDEAREERHPLLEALDDCEYMHGRINIVRQRISEMREAKDEEIYFYAGMEFLHLDNYVRRVGDRLKDYVIKEGIE